MQGVFNKYIHVIWIYAHVLYKKTVYNPQLVFQLQSVIWHERALTSFIT